MKPEQLRALAELVDWVETNTPYMNQVRSDTRLYRVLTEARAALAATVAQPKVCRGIPRVGCNYLMTCDEVCNKCGQVHDSQHVAAHVVAQPLTEEQLRDILRDVSPGQIPASYTSHWPGLKAFARAVERAVRGNKA